MYFANPWGLLGLLAIPAILAIHLYHRRFPPMYVAGAHLWASETQVRMAGRRRDTLPVTTTLLLELLAALLLSLALAQPRVGDLDQIKHLVVILDNSASMQAKAPDGPSARDAALAVLESRLKGRERTTVVTLIETGPRPQMLGGLAIPWDEAQQAIAAWKPNLPRHQFAPAWDEAQALVEEHGEMLFLTDAVPDPQMLPVGLEVVSVGQRLENVAISSARWTFDSATAQGTAFVRLQNMGRKTASVTVRGTSEKQTIFERPLQLAAGAAAAFEAQVPGGLQTLQIETISADDGLATDSSVLLVEPKVRTVFFTDTLPESVARQQIEKAMNVLPDVAAAGLGQTHLLIGSARVLPESSPDLWWLGIGPISDVEADRQAAKDLLGPFLVDKRHPLMDGILLGGVVWGGVQPFDMSVTPLISAGDSVLFSELRGTRTRGFLMNIDLARSNITESADWPILLSNLVELRREALPGLRRWNYRLGEDVGFRLYEGIDPTPDDTLALVHDDRDRRLDRTGLIELPPLDDVGLYEIRSGSEVFDRFAVNYFDPFESDLTKLAPGTHQPQTPNDGGGFGVDSLYSWTLFAAAILVLLALFADWYVLRPRRFSK